MKIKILTLLAAALAAGAVHYKRKSDSNLLEEIDIPDPNDPEGINRSQASITKEGFLFRPLKVEGPGVALDEVALSEDEELMVVEREQKTLYFRLPEMAYHHVAQGEINGEAFAVSF